MMNFNYYIQELEGMYEHSAFHVAKIVEIMCVTYVGAIAPSVLYSHNTQTVGCHIPTEDGAEESFSLGLESLLAFITGADQPPPLGCENKRRISFTDTEISKLSTASTCAPALYVSVHLTDCDEFQRVFDFALTSSNMFGQV